MPRPTRLTRSKYDPRLAYHHLAETLRDLETDLRWGLRGSPRIPEAWVQLAQAPIEPAKVKVTLRLDEDLVDFFRAMGRGYLTRMNAVLRAFMLARLADVIDDAPDYDFETEDEIDALMAELSGRHEVSDAEGEAKLTRLRLLLAVKERRGRG